MDERYRLVYEIGTGRGADSLTFMAVVRGGFDDRGRLVVGEYGTRRLLRVDLDAGRIERIGGGQGEGPGEFVELSEFGVHRDGTIRHADPLFGRVTVIDLESEHATARTIRDYFFAPPIAAGGPRWALADGSWLARPERAELPTLFPDTLVFWPLVRVDASGNVLDTILDPPRAAIGGFVLSDGSRTRRVFAEDPLVEVSPDGRRVGFLHRIHGLSEDAAGTLYVAHVDGSDSVTVDVLEIPMRPLEGSVTAVEARVNAMLVNEEMRRRVFEELMDRYDIPEWISPIEAFRLDSEGGTWVGVAEQLGGEKRWYRYTATEAVGGGEDREAWTEVRTDRPIWRMIDAHGDRLAGVLRDTLMVQTLGIFERVR